jgi:hypothetical protein
MEEIQGTGKTKENYGKERNMEKTQKAKKEERRQFIVNYCCRITDRIYN